MFFTGLFTGLMVGVGYFEQRWLDEQSKENNVEVPLTEDNLKKWNESR